MTTSNTRIVSVVDDTQVEMSKVLVWEFFDFLRGRYPDMIKTIDTYLQEQDVAGELDRFTELFFEPKGQCLLAYADGEAAGIVMLKRVGEKDCELNRMYVRENARGLGLGRQLCNVLVQNAREMGFDTFYLDALYRHHEALPLYESIGFVRYTDPNAFEGDDERVIHMKMQLKG